ncbi:YadA-like family protein, partial [Sphingopyxis sp. KK2]|uniref:YadA-like family protein n=1 Tax=Sphingopyxis sp. KK2 TaxID=1855727 RepID=UPI0015C3403E
VASGNLSLASGHQAQAAGIQATAVGKNANAAFDNSTAVGFGATTTRANQVKLGGTGSSVTVGDIAASTAAQTGTLSFATVDASGTLGAGPTVSSLATASALAATNANVSALQTLTATHTSQIGTLFAQSEDNRREARLANEGVALALSMETPALPSDAKFGFSGGIGYYNDRTAGSVAMTARISEKATFSAGVGAGFDSGEIGARGGFQVVW